MLLPLKFRSLSVSPFFAGSRGAPSTPGFVLLDEARFVFVDVPLL